MPRQVQPPLAEGSWPFAPRTLGSSSRATIGLCSDGGGRGQPCLPRCPEARLAVTRRQELWRGVGRAVLGNALPRSDQLAGTGRLGHRLARSPGKGASYVPHPPPSPPPPRLRAFSVTRWGSREGSQRVPHLSDLLAGPCPGCAQIRFRCGSWNTDRKEQRAVPGEPASSGVPVGLISPRSDAGN